MLDPKNGKVTYLTPPEDPSVPVALGPGHAADLKPMAASAYWGTEQVWDTQINNHNDMIDSEGQAVADRDQSRPRHAGVLPQGFG